MVKIVTMAGSKEFFFVPQERWDIERGREGGNCGESRSKGCIEGGGIVFKFKIPLEKAARPDIIGYPDVPVDGITRIPIYFG